LLCCLAAAQEPAHVVSTLTAPEGHEFEDCVLDDVNRDGLQDLVILISGPEKPPRRRVAIHLRSADRPTVPTVPTRTVNLTADVSAFTLMDLGHPDGKQVLLLTRSGAWVRSGDTDGRVRARQLMAGQFLWQLPYTNGAAIRCPHVVTDVDGDGLDDLVLPEDGAWRIGIQSRDESGNARFESVSRIVVPSDAQDLRSRGDLRMEGLARRNAMFSRMRGEHEESDGAPLLAVSESVPAPQFADWDGDGTLDILAATPESLHVWRRPPDGSFPDQPTHTFPSPVAVDRERQMDISYSAHVTDLNGDGRADCVYIAGNRRSDDVRTQVLLYVQGSKGRGAAATTPAAPLFGPRGVPVQLLQFAGFAGFPQLEDINGDGRPDLSLVTFRPDLIDTMRARTARSIDLGWSIFLNKGGSFARRADVQSEVALSVTGLKGADSLAVTRLFPDINGDGLAEALVQDSERRLRLLSLTRSGRSLTRAEKPLWKFSWGFEGSVVSAPPGGKHKALVIRGNRQLMHVRFDP